MHCNHRSDITFTSCGVAAVIHLRDLKTCGHLVGKEIEATDGESVEFVLADHLFECFDDRAVLQCNTEEFVHVDVREFHVEHARKLLGKAAGCDEPWGRFTDDAEVRILLLEEGGSGGGGEDGFDGLWVVDGAEDGWSAVANAVFVAETSSEFAAGGV